MHSDICHFAFGRGPNPYQDFRHRQDSVQKTNLHLSRWFWLGAGFLSKCPAPSRFGSRAKRRLSLCFRSVKTIHWTVLEADSARTENGPLDRFGADSAYNWRNCSRPRIDDPKAELFRASKPAIARSNSVRLPNRRFQN